MSELDSAPGKGTQDANLGVSTPDGQPNSFDPEQFAEKLKADILASLRTDKTLAQSVKDRAIAEVKKDKGFKDFLDEYRTLKAEGKTDEQIVIEARLREIEERTVNQPPAKAGNLADDDSNELDELLPALGLDATDPDALRIMGQPITAVAKTKELVKLSQRRKQQPGPAAVSQPSGSSQPKNDVSEKVKKYEELSKSPTIHAAELSALKKELDAVNWGQ